MNKVYNQLEAKGNALIESPTGSGKTLALLAPSMHYLMKWRKTYIEENIEQIKDIKRSLPKGY